MTTKTLKPSGGDFSTFAGWVAYLSATLSAPEQIDIYKKSGGYNENNAISGITTTNTNRLIINVPTSERGNGTPHSGAYLTNSSATVLRLGTNIDYVTIDGLEIEGTGTAAALLDSLGAHAGANQHLIQHCFLHSSDRTVDVSGGNQVYIYRNNIIYTDSSNRQFDPRFCASMEVSNCIFFNRGTDLGLICNTESTIKNTYSGGSSSGDYWTGGSPSGNNNVSSDATATNRFPTGSQNSKAASSVFTSVTSGAEDFRLKSGANVLVDAGATLTAVTDDFIGTSRPQNSIYDVGAFERASSGNALTASAALSGTGSSSAVAVRRMFSAKALSAAATLTAVAKRQLKDSANLSGSGSLSASAKRQLNGVVGLSGTGTATAAARREKHCAAALSGAGSFTCAAVARLFGRAALSGAGSLTAAATLAGAGEAAASLSGTSSLAARANKRGAAVATLSATSAFSAVATKPLVGIVSFTGNGQLAAAASGFKKAAAALAGLSDLDAEGTLGSEEELEIDPAGFVWSEKRLEAVLAFTPKQSFLAGR